MDVLLPLPNPGADAERSEPSVPLLASITDPVDRDRVIRGMIRGAKFQRNRMQVCVWPTSDGPCLTTGEDLVDFQKSIVVLLQEHLRDAHLGPTFQGDENYDRFTRMLRGSGVHLGDSSRWLSGAYVYRLANDQVWMFAGTSEQFDEWSSDNAETLSGDGNREFITPERTPAS